MPKNPFSCLEIIGREWSNLLTLENILQINDWKIFGSSKQPLYGSGAGGKQARGLQWAESCPSVQKKIDWLAAHSYNTQGSSVTRMGACGGTPGHLQSQLSWESDPWGLHLGGQSLLWCGPLQTGHGAWGGLDAWGQSCSRYPPFHSNNKSVPFHLGPSGHFFRLFPSRSNSLCWDLSLLPGSFLPLIFLLLLYTTIYQLSQL